MDTGEDGERLAGRMYLALSRPRLSEGALCVVRLPGLSVFRERLSPRVLACACVSLMPLMYSSMLRIFEPIMSPPPIGMPGVPRTLRETLGLAAEICVISLAEAPVGNELGMPLGIEGSMITSSIRSMRPSLFLSLPAPRETDC